MSEFKKKLEDIINRCSKENGSDTPDFILAEYLIGCLETFDRATRLRTEWYAETPCPAKETLELKDRRE